jgi:hypothetical protein
VGNYVRNYILSQHGQRVNKYGLSISERDVHVESVNWLGDFRGRVRESQA